MMEKVKKVVRNSLNTFGFQIIRVGINDYDIEEDEAFMKVYEKCKDFTMTSKESMYSLHKSVDYVIKSNIPGDFVECGVWRGGSVMLIALMLIELNVQDRRIFLYDTFSGMSEPSENDISRVGKKSHAIHHWKKENRSKYNEWCYASLKEVKSNLFSTNYPRNNIVFCPGKVEDTIPGIIPSNIALLRLDTDWYESTRHELIHLYPRLNQHGILIIDDYGHWAGAQKAVDEYFIDKTIFLNRIDHTVRMAVKTEN